jgi:hypothetical protein
MFKWIMKLSTAAKVIMSIVGLLSFLIGALAWHASFTIKRYNERQEQVATTEDINLLKDGFKVVVDSLSVFSSELRSTNNRLQGIDDNIRQLNTTNTNLKNYMMRTAATKEDVLDVIQIWNEAEKKKNGTGLFPIPSTQEGYKTVLK